MTSPNNQNSPLGSLGSIVALFVLIAIIYLIILVRKYFKNHCVKCGKQFWTWNPLDNRKACFPCRKKIDKAD